jgi:hypothetical protein
MKICKEEECKNPIFSHLYCLRHQNKRTDDKFKAKMKSATTFCNKVKSKTGELEFFIDIWTKMKPAREMTKTIEELESMQAVEYFNYIQQFRICAITLEPLSIFIVHNFSHILPKSKYKRFRLEPSNIKVVKYEIHQIWEFESRDKLLQYVGGRKIQEYADYLKQKYNGQAK